MQLEQFNPDKTYWNGAGKYPQQEELSAQLMPAMGKANTYEGELIRASSKIYWDLYNNGFGNNWSGAWNFLAESPLDIQNELEQLADYRCGLVQRGRDKMLYAAVESLADKVYEYVLEKDGKYTPNEVDMWDFQEPDEYEEEEPNEEYDSEYDFGNDEENEDEQ